MKRHFGAAVVSIGLILYAVAFGATPLPNVCTDAGRPLLRAELLWQLFWLPDQHLFPVWFGAPPEFSLLDRLPALLVAGIIVAWATILGWLVCRAIKLPARLAPLETFVFSAAVGLNLVSTWVLLLGLFGVMDRLWMFVAPAVLTFTAACYFWFNNSRRPTAGGQNIETDPVANNALSLHWLWLAVPFLLAILLAGVLPPLDFDVREYHLQAPKEFFQQGRITFLAHNVYADMALGTEMLSLLAMVLTGDWWLGALAGKTVIAAFTPLTALALLAAGRRLFSPTAGVAAALIYVSIPWVVSVASGGFVEGASACYLFLAVYALLMQHKQVAASWEKGDSPRPTFGRCPPERPEGCFAQMGTVPFFSLLVMAGYLAGAAVAAKYPAALFVLLPLAVWVLFAGVWKTFEIRRLAAAGTATLTSFQAAVPAAAKRLVVFLLAAAVACGLWFGKNWALAGNPTYPLLYRVFDGRFWDAEKERQWNNVHRPRDFSAKTLGKDLGRVVLTSPWISPLTVPLAVLTFFGLGRRFQVRWALLAYMGFVVAAWWLLTHRIDRFWIPVLPVAALLAGVGACWTEARWWRRALAAMLLIGLGANFLVASMGQGNAWFVSLAKLRNAPGWIDPWHEYFNTHPADGKILCVGDAAVFDLDMPALYNTCFDDCVFEQLVRDKSSGEIRAELSARRIAYVYVNWGEIARYRRTYGYTEFVRPEVFDRLAAEGLLAPLPAIEGSSGQGYRVRPGRALQLLAPRD